MSSVNPVSEFLRRIIPVDLWIWILFFLLPSAAALVWQILLCLRSKKTWTKFLPLIVAAALPIVIYGCHFLDILQPVFGGFVGLFLLFTAAFIAGGSLVGWLIYGILKLVRK